jgi:hypothetical protein
VVVYVSVVRACLLLPVRLMCDRLLCIKNYARGQMYIGTLDKLPECLPVQVLVGTAKR